jgi:vitamin B12 transporter
VRPPPTRESNTNPRESNTSPRELNTSPREINTSPREINTSTPESNTSLQGVRPIQRWIRPILSLTLSITALLAPSIALSETAAPAAPPTEEMIVTASHTPRSRTTLSQSVSVIEAEQLNSSISTSLDDVLRFIPGLQVTREGARGGRSQISLRGLDPNHVVILIDGVRLNDPTNSRGGSFDPTTLALLDIERVEIVRGALSAVYGSDALAGAINIITKRAAPSDPLEASVRIRGGRFHTGNVIAQASTGLGNSVGLSFGAALDTFRDPNSDGGYDGTNLKAKINAPLPGGVDLEGFFRLARGSARGFPESSGGPELATLRTMEDRNIREILFGGSLKVPILDLGGVELRVSRASRREKIDSPGIDPVLPFNPFTDVPPSRNSDEYWRWDLSLVSNWTPPQIEIGPLNLGTRFLIGADAAFENGESDAFLNFGGGFESQAFYDHRRTVGVFVEVEESIGEYLTLSGSLRFDTTPDENDRFSPALGAALKIPYTTMVAFGNYSEGFKRPSFYALGSPLIGNPALRLETSRGWELGIRATALDGKLRGQLSYFDTKVNNLIDFDTLTFSLINRSRLVSQGVELEFSWQALEWLDLRGGVTYNQTNFAGLSEPDPTNRPNWRSYAEFAIEPVPSVELALRILAVSSVKATSFQTGARIKNLNAYGRVDIRAAWSATDWIDLFIEIENLTNRTYREAVGFESPGIAPRAGITLWM